MIYLTMLVSDLPVLAVMAQAQKIYVRAEVQVPDEFKNYPAEKAADYLKSLAQVISEDAEDAKAVKSTPPPPEDDNA